MTAQIDNQIKNIFELGIQPNSHLINFSNIVINETFMKRILHYIDFFYINKTYDDEDIYNEIIFDNCSINNLVFLNFMNKMRKRFEYVSFKNNLISNPFDETFFKYLKKSESQLINLDNNYISSQNYEFYLTKILEFRLFQTIIIPSLFINIFKLREKFELNFISLNDKIVNNRVIEIDINEKSIADIIKLPYRYIKVFTDDLLLGFDIMKVINYLGLQIPDYEKTYNNDDVWVELYTFLVQISIHKNKFCNTIYNENVFSRDIIQNTFLSDRLMLYFTGLYTYTDFNMYKLCKKYRQTKYISLPKKVTYLLYTNLYNYLNNAYNIYFTSEIDYLIPLVYNLYFMSPSQIIEKNNNFMIFPPQIQTEEEKNRYYITKLYAYQDYITRKNPPNGKLNFNIDIKNIFKFERFLRICSDNELNQIFILDGLIYKGRYDLEKKIRSFKLLEFELPERHVWTTINSIKGCVNPEEFDLLGIKLERNDPENPIISFGKLGVYRSYNIEDLYQTWNPKDLIPNELNLDNFNFRNPYYTPETLIQEGKYQDTLETFSRYDILYLKEFIEKYTTSRYKKLNLPIYSKMVNFLAKYFPLQNDQVKKYQNTIIDIYNKYPTELKKIFIYSFILGMISRFWEGLEKLDSWPYKFDDDKNKDKRDKRFSDMHLVLDKFIDSTPNEVQAWIKTLTLLNINWRSKEPTFLKNLYSTILNDAIMANMCLAHFSDLFTQTSWYIYTQCFGLSNQEFNQKLKQTILELVDQRNKTGRYQIFNLKIDDIQDFIPENMGKTQHIDPEHHFRNLNNELDIDII